MGSMTPSPPLVRQWPLFGLAVHTPRLTLRYVDDASAAALMALAASAGVHDPAEMPFTLPWTRSASPLLEQEGLRRYWRARAQTSRDAWTLPFAVHEGERLVGQQNLRAADFVTLRSVGSASWVARPEQGRGIGREMRAAVLHLAFAGLGAVQATSGAFEDNPASLAVSRSLGYADNGADLTARDGRAVRDLRMVLERATWEQTRRDDIRVEGLAPCLPLLGLDAP
jgi:RimJ/RimL family protein N-acetyltransferase